jgi:hypothetical protein
VDHALEGLQRLTGCSVLDGQLQLDLEKGQAVDAVAVDGVGADEDLGIALSQLLVAVALP